MGKWFMQKGILLILLSMQSFGVVAQEGVHIASMEELNLPIIVKKAILSNQKQMDAKGYIESSDNDAEFLLHREGKKDGWVGARKIFRYPGIGYCAYSQTEIITVELSKESTVYLINEKPTSILVEGNVRNGFLYEVSWYAGALMRTLECANREYDKRIVGEMLGLAVRIDGGAYL